MTDANARFDALAGALATQGADRRKMMGRPMLAIGGKMFACLDKGMLAVRLGAGSEWHARAMAVPGAIPFSPGESGRSFRDWVSLPVAHSAQWEDFALVALERLR